MRSTVRREAFLNVPTGRHKGWAPGTFPNRVAFTKDGVFQSPYMSISTAYVWAWAAGGVGGGASRTKSGGGGGGGGFVTVAIQLGPRDELQVTVGSGGAGGRSATSKSSRSGSAGGDTYVSWRSTRLRSPVAGLVEGADHSLRARAEQEGLDENQEMVTLWRELRES